MKPQSPSTEGLRFTEVYMDSDMAWESQDGTLSVAECHNPFAVWTQDWISCVLKGPGFFPNNSWGMLSSDSETGNPLHSIKICAHRRHRHLYMYASYIYMYVHNISICLNVYTFINHPESRISTYTSEVHKCKYVQMHGFVLRVEHWVYLNFSPIFPRS